MKKSKTVIYWITTALLCFGMLGSGIAQILQVKDMVDLFTHIGYPIYLMPILGIWKVLGVIAILVPKFVRLKEWAYAGFIFLLTGALFSHLAMGDAGKAIFGPLFQTVFAFTSWYLRPASRKIASENT